MRSAFARVTAAIGTLSIAACSGQSGSVPGSGARGPTYLTQANESQPVRLLTGSVPAQAQDTVLYSFAGGSEGRFPSGTLTNVNGVLYGTTLGERFYGTGDCSPELPCGIVFKITTSGAESVLYGFKGGSDGSQPNGLTNVNGVLYGTTSRGGAESSSCFSSGLLHCGTVFKITTSGAESVLYRFAGGTDGARPLAALTNVNGVLYGTTAQGGANNYGTVFKITTSGEESVLYSFAGGRDGEYPEAGLTNVDGVLYGTTFGNLPESNCTGMEVQGCGSIFKITTSGALSVLHDFAGGSDGLYPASGLTNINGVLYGATFGGTVFKITTSGKESVIYEFGSHSGDGQLLNEGLTNVGDALYGTTYLGGLHNEGTVFKITTSGAESILYNFLGELEGTGDGASPYSGVTDVNGVLYGTTVYGGANNLGTVFSLPL